jgi:hypothetical protein
LPVPQGYRPEQSLHLLVNCDGRELVLASARCQKTLTDLFEDFKEWNKQKNCDPDCRNFLGWLLICTDLTIVGFGTEEYLVPIDTFIAPCRQQKEFNRLGV